MLIFIKLGVCWYLEVIFYLVGDDLFWKLCNRKKIIEIDEYNILFRVLVVFEKLIIVRIMVVVIVVYGSFIFVLNVCIVVLVIYIVIRLKNNSDFYIFFLCLFINF